MLRSLGKKHGSDNTSDCRDLNGRRLRDVEAAKQAAEWAAGQKDRDAAKEEAKKEREAGKQAQRDAEEQVRCCSPRKQESLWAGTLGHVQPAQEKQPVSFAPSALTRWSQSM